MFKKHENVLLKTQSEPLQFEDFEKKEGSYISIRKPARLKLAPKENFNLQKMLEAGVDLKQVNCKILEPKFIDLRPKKTATSSKITQTTQTEE